MRYCIKRGINYYEHGTKFVRSIEIISLSIKYSGSVSTSLNFLFTSGKPRNSWREYRYTRIQSTYVPKCDRYYQPRERLCFWSSKGPAKTTRLFSKSSPPLSYHSCSKLVHAFHLPERDEKSGWEILAVCVLRAGSWAGDVSYTGDNPPALCRSCNICAGFTCVRDMFAVMTSFIRRTEFIRYKNFTLQLPARKQTRFT